MSVASLDKYLRQEVKPDVILLADFPKETCHPQTLLHYLTRIYAQQNLAGEVEQVIQSLVTEGQINDPLETSRDPTSWTTEQLDGDIKHIRDRDNDLRRKVLGVSEPTNGMTLFYNQDAFIIQCLLNKGYKIAFAYIEKEDPLEKITINQYPEVGALVQKLDEDARERTEFVSVSKYKDILSYKEYTTRWHEEYRKRCSKGLSLSEIVGEQTLSPRQLWRMLRIALRLKRH